MELKERISQGEGSRLDFMFRIDDQRKIARTLVAFANSYGGSLLIGVKDNGKIAGVNPEEEFHMIQEAADMFTKPEVEFESKTWQEGHHFVLEIIVEKSESKHKALDDDGKLRSYVRVDDHTLVGNKILDKIWQLEKFGRDRPEPFDEDTLGLIQSIRELQPVTISQLYRSIPLSKNTVDGIVSVLVFWNVINMEMNISGTFYCTD
ncbi:MAG: ATP-binding protein [Crocinitomicaceae bacterium]|nr:ATP-binding protein [Flavobacteriales bacterium]NQZ37371.1 ATP-binding protein [Crocinitomicaceae bacterium]